MGNSPSNNEALRELFPGVNWEQSRPARNVNIDC